MYFFIFPITCGEKGNTADYYFLVQAIAVGANYCQYHPYPQEDIKLRNREKPAVMRVATIVTPVMNHLEWLF